MNKVYLAGAISGCGYGEVTDWREYVCEQLSPHGINGFSPLRGKDYLNTGGLMPDHIVDKPLSTTRAIMTRDYFDCRTADVILVNVLGTTRVSIGTVMEIGFAFSHRVPVVLVMEKEGNLHQHAMIQEAIGYHVETLDEGINIVKAILLPI